MKKSKILSTMILCLSMLLTLTACGKSAEAKAAEELIAAIGQVTVDSQEAVEKAEATYAALSEEDQKAVSNYGTLTAAREALDAAQLAALQQAIVGKWQFEGDYAAGMEEAINASYSSVDLPAFRLDSFPVNLLYTFRDDGTYEASMDPDVMKSSMEQFMKALGSWMDDYLLKALGDALMEQGYAGDFTTWAGLEQAAGMTRAEIYEASLGMSLEDYIQTITDSLQLDQLSESAHVEGRYEVELGRLYMNEALDKEITKTDYTKISVNDKIMTWLGYVGNGNGGFVYPAVFDRVG